MSENEVDFESKDWGLPQKEDILQENVFLNQRSNTLAPRMSA